MRVARGWLLKKIKKEHGMTIDDIIYDLEFTGDASIKVLWGIVKSNANEIIMTHQRNEIKLWSAVFLWIISKDTAYRDMFFSIAKQILDAKDEIYDDTCKLAKDPEHWYPNAHQKAIIRRNKGQKDGTLLERGRPYDETILVPAVQKPRIIKPRKGRDVEKVIVYK